MRRSAWPDLDNGVCELDCQGVCGNFDIGGAINFDKLYKLSDYETHKSALRNGMIDSV